MMEQWGVEGLHAYVINLLADSQNDSKANLKIVICVLSLKHYFKNLDNLYIIGCLKCNITFICK